MKAWDINTGRVKKVKVLDVVPMPNSVVDAVNKWGKRYQKEKKRKMGKFLDRLKRDFAWENDEYDTPEEAPIHPEISAHGNFGREFYFERISYFSQNYRDTNSFT